MGCCCEANRGYATTHKANMMAVNIQQMMQNQAQIVGQTASVPRMTATGDILVPMNYISGEFPISFPVQLKQYQITREIYSQFINELNATTMPILAQQQQAQSNIVNQGMSGMRMGMNGMQGMMERMGQFQAQIMQIQQSLIVNTDTVLLKWNQSTFQPKGVQWESSLPNAAMTNASQIGVILKKIPQQTVVVVQQVQPQQQTFGENEDEAPPPYQQDEATPLYQEGMHEQYTMQ